MQRKASVRKKDERPQAIIDSALKLFTTKGFDATSFADIAKDCNIARSTIYLYFADKNDLMEKVIISKFSENSTHFLQGDIEPGRNKQEFIQNVLEKLINSVNIQEHAPFYVMVAGLARRYNGIAEIMKTHILEPMKKIWHEICAKQNFSEEEEKLYLYLLYSLYLTAMYLDDAYGEDSPLIKLDEFVRLSKEQFKKETLKIND